MGADPTTLRSTTGSSAVELRVHGGRCRYRSHAGLSRVRGSFQDCLPGHERHLPKLEPSARIELASAVYGTAALPLSYEGMESTARLERAHSSFADCSVDRFTTWTCWCARSDSNRPYPN